MCLLFLDCAILVTWGRETENYYKEKRWEKTEKDKVPLSKKYVEENKDKKFADLALKDNGKDIEYIVNKIIDTKEKYRQ